LRESLLKLPFKYLCEELRDAGSAISMLSETDFDSIMARSAKEKPADRISVQTLLILAQQHPKLGADKYITTKTVEKHLHDVLMGVLSDKAVKKISAKEAPAPGSLLEYMLKHVKKK
jgi:hypothetical protein